MKYIRTKNGRIIDLDRVVDETKVIHLEKNQLEGDNWAGWYWYSEEYGYELECRDLDIVKQVDTIEELCDEFASICEDNIPEILVPKYVSPRDTLITAWKNRFEDEMCYENVIIYGAIWTDKGLIYVAKLNEKGNLELL